MKRFYLIRGVIPAVALVITFCSYSPAGLTYPASQTSDIDLPHRLRNSPEHDAARSRNGGNPYILEVNTANGGALLYYGASHTQSPDHPQIADITAQWERFKPSVAFYEGRRRNFYYGALVEPFAGLPEPALVHKLARPADIPLYTLEPAYEDEVGALLREFSAKQIALYFFLRVYRSESGGQAKERLAKDLLAKRTDVVGLKGSLNTLADVDRVWERDFPSEGDWRIHRAEVGYLKEISTASRRLRGEHMIRILVDQVNRGERVFAVVGSGHVIRQEWNFREILGQVPAWDQPVSQPDSRQ